MFDTSRRKALVNMQEKTLRVQNNNEKLKKINAPGLQETSIGLMFTIPQRRK